MPVCRRQACLRLPVRTRTQTGAAHRQAVVAAGFLPEPARIGTGG